MNTSTVVIGLVLIVIGFIFFWLFCLGVILVLAGLVVMVIGLMQEEQPRTVVQYYPPMYPQQPYQQQPYYQVPGTQQGAMNFCQSCGQQLYPGAQSCPRCGRRMN
ncbi:MAG: zinc-ribbon domain-containing protein [Thermoplasmata archaeon]|nr:zinc-ribbon domain-containing protein [Thermoplasmata archaeon]